MYQIQEEISYPDHHPIAFLGECHRGFSAAFRHRSLGRWGFGAEAPAQIRGGTTCLPSAGRDSNL